MEIKRVKPRRLYEDVLEQLYGLIQNRELATGDILPPERELAEQFGVSRGTLREAFRILEKEGLIYSTPGGGRYISDSINRNTYSELIQKFEKASIHDLYEIREVLETAIAGMAAERATAEDIEDMLESLEMLTNGGCSEDSNRYFHVSLANATHNILMADMIKVNLGLISKNKNTKLADPERKLEIYKEHKDIVDAIMQRDKQKAIESMRHHITMGLRNVTADPET